LKSRVYNLIFQLKVSGHLSLLVPILVEMNCHLNQYEPLCTEHKVTV
jgi:hypothetical protein